MNNAKQTTNLRIENLPPMQGGSYEALATVTLDGYTRDLYFDVSGLFATSDPAFWVSNDGEDHNHSLTLKWDGEAWKQCRTPIRDQHGDLLCYAVPGENTRWMFDEEDLVKMAGNLRSDRARIRFLVAACRANHLDVSVDYVITLMRAVPGCETYRYWGASSYLRSSGMLTEEEVARDTQASKAPRPKSLWKEQQAALAAA